jgi:hypothetical protein
MSLKSVQNLLAQIYTNSQMRQDFLKNPEQIGKTFGLNAEEIKQLSQISSSQVHIFANSLKNKRLGEVRELLPFTYQVLGKEFNKLFWQYAETYLPAGIKKHRDDAVAFSLFLENLSQTQKIEPVWVADVIKYERCRLQASNLTQKLIISQFSYSIAPLIRSLQNQEKEPVLISQHSVAIWFRLSPQKTLEYQMFILPKIFSIGVLKFP